MLNNTQSAIATKSATIIPNDNAEVVAHGLYVGTGGTLTVRLREGSTAIFKNVASGCVLPISVTVVFATGTTCTDIVGLG